MQKYLLLLLLIFLPSFSYSAEKILEPYTSIPKQEEQAFIAQWAQFMVHSGIPNERYTADVPFSFFCGKRSSREWIKADKATIQLKTDNDRFRKYVLSWHDDVTGIVCEMELTEFRTLPVLEWVICLRNDGKKDTEPVFDFQAIDIEWKNGSCVTPDLFYAPGSRNLPDDFKLTRKRMRSLEQNAFTFPFFSGPDRRTSHEWLPFFNYRTGEDGIILGLGWNGGWHTHFDHRNGSTHITAGMVDLKAKLHPGERIRSTRIAILYYREPFMHGQNMFRRFMMEYHTPQQNGKPVLAPISLSGWGRPQAEHMAHIAVVKKYKIPIDTYWIDAAWYGDDDQTWWTKLGDWEVGKIRYPSGSLRPVSDAAAEAGMKFLLWVEPLRVMGCTKAAKEHTDCFLRQKKGEITDNEQLLLDLTSEKGLKYGIDLISGIIDKFNVKWYREDFNMNPGPNWSFNDGPDRAGITEIHYAEGFYRFWDTLLKKYPDLAIDQCASGGRRIELEALSRSIPLWRDDYNCTDYKKAEETQNHSYNLSYWFAGHGTGNGNLEKYYFRNVFCPGISFSYGTISNLNLLKDLVTELQRAKEYFYGDYYPLMDGGPDLNGWAAYHYYLPEKKKGMLMAIRRPESDVRAMNFEILTVDPKTNWEFENVDSGVVQTFSGKELREKGFNVEISNPREAHLYFYRQK